MSDPGIVVVAGQGSLTIDGVSLSTPAWWTLDLSPLWGFPDVRGSSIVIPGVPGRSPNVKRVDETVYRVPMHITGAVDLSGAPYSDPVMGLATNLDYLWANVASPSDAIVRDAVLEMPDATIRAATVQVQIVLGALMGAYDKPADLFITAPDGAFEVSGS